MERIGLGLAIFWLFGLIYFASILGTVGLICYLGISLLIILITFFVLQEKQQKLEEEKQQKLEEESRKKILEEKRKERERKRKIEEEKRNQQEIKFIGENSLLIKKLVTLNKNYNSNENVCKNHNMDYICVNKKEFDNFNVDNFLVQVFRKDLNFYNDFKNIVDEEEKKWNNYSKKYNDLKKYGIKEENYNYFVPFQKFKEYEDKIYKTGKKMKYDLPSFTVNLEYTTPANRFFYRKQFCRDYNEFLGLVEIANQPEEEKVSQSSLRSLDKERQKLEAFEKELKQQAENLKKQQEEFLLATKGHIYSGDVSKETPQQYNTGINEEKIETKSIMDNLKELKQKFESGEISYEEYEKKRKELM